MHSAADLEAEYQALVRNDPTKAIEGFDEHLDRYLLAAEASVDGQARLFRQAALAARSTRDIERSNRYIERGLAAVEGTAHDADRIRLFLTRAYNDFLLGDHDRAVELVSSLTAGDDLLLQAQIDMQRSTILGRLGQTRLAIDALTDALRSAESVGNESLQSDILKNRGMFRATDGDYEGSLADTRAAGALFTKLGMEFDAAFCEHNLGLAASYAGDLPMAFAQFERAERRILELSGSDFESKAGHCRALMFGGLFREAAAMAGRAADQCEAAGFHVDGAESRLLEAAALLEMGDLASAGDRATRAAAAFEAQGRQGWHAAATTIQLLVDHRLGREVDPESVRAAIDRLTTDGLRRDAIEAELLLAEILIGRGDLDGASEHLARLQPEVEGGATDLQLAAATVEAQLQLERRDPAAAEQTAAAGFRLLAERQALIGSSDLRVGLRQHSDRLARLGSSIALAAGDGQRVLTWNERIALATSSPRPVRPPDPEMRRAVAKLRSMEGDDEGERRRLEESIRTLDRTRPVRSRPIHPAPIDELAGRLDGTVGLSFAIDQDDLIACSLDDTGPTILRIGPVDDILRTVRALRADLRTRAANPARAKVARIEAALDRLDQQVLGPIGLDGRRAVVCGPAQLAALPWGALPSRRTSQTTVATSLTAWSVTRPASSGHDTVLVAGADLDHAGDETGRIADELSTSRVLEAATVADTLAAIDGASVAHIVAHGTVRTDNPLFSSLLLADGELNVYEVGDLNAAPAVVVLSACHVGLPAEAPGQELLGMVTGFLNAGTSCVLASTLPVPDDRSTIEMMRRFHRFLAGGLGPAVAWAEVQRTCTDDEQLLDTATFTLFGRG